MKKPQTLTILYTSNIQGDIHMLPHLYTFLQTLKPSARQGTLIFDLGYSCVDDVWHCSITNGRSTLIILDAMGYHAANVQGQLDAVNRDKLRDTVTMGLVHASHPWQYHIPPVTDHTIQATLNPSSDSHRLQICLSPAESTYINDNSLFLADVPAKHIGLVKVDLNHQPLIITHSKHKLPDNIPPNPTIVASVEFVESEARYFEKKQSNS